MSKQNVTFLAPNKGLTVTSSNWAYAYSGTFEASTSSATMFDFQSPKKILKGKFTFNAQTRFLQPAYGGYSAFQISFNGNVVSISKCDSGNNDAPTQTFQKVIIPPHTHVVVECLSGEDTANELITATFSGRVYG